MINEVKNTTALVSNQTERVAMTINEFYEPDMSDFELRNDGGSDVSFTGYRLGSTTSLSERNNKRWTDLNLYITKGGSYICEEVGRSTVPGEKTLCTVDIATTITEVIEFFGDGWLAKRLYISAGIKASVHVA